MSDASWSWSRAWARAGEEAREAAGVGLYSDGGEAGEGGVCRVGGDTDLRLKGDRDLSLTLSCLMSAAGGEELGAGDCGDHVLGVGDTGDRDPGLTSDLPTIESRTGTQALPQTCRR